MKAIIATLTLLATSQMAQASGYICEAEDGPLKVKIYNHTQPELGTRTAALMVLSDTDVGGGNKTIARFTDVEGNIASKSQTYTAKVDLRFNNSSRAGENILGTKLGQVKTVVVDVYHSYRSPVAHGDEVGAEITLIKRNGEKIVSDMVCTRYLKN